MRTSFFFLMLMMIQNYLSFGIENFILGAYHKKLTLNLDLFSSFFSSIMRHKIQDGFELPLAILACKRLYQYISKPEMVHNI
uniref:Secreted protein n=1 Tax=Populus trichocarpa TaxID=3694 RepID=U5GFL9_POPTR